MTEPILSSAIVPKGRQEELKAANALSRLCEQDTLLRMRTNSNSAELMMLGVSEAHLRQVQDRLAREFDVKTKFGPLKVFYREGIRRTVREEARFIREIDGRRQFAHCILELKPLPKNAGFEFIDGAKGKAVSAHAVSIEKGVRRALENGPLHGYPIVGVRATLIDGSVEAGSDQYSFEIAGGMALRAGCGKADPVLLEPIMLYEVMASESDSDTVMENLKSRRAESLKIIGEPSRLIRCLIPMSELLVNAEKPGTDRAAIKIELSHFKALPSETGPAKA